jgi:hypothetical protein
MIVIHSPEEEDLGGGTLYLGDLKAAQDLQALQEHDITHII